MEKILLIFAHPESKASYANTIILNEIQKEYKIHVRDLMQLYPDFQIDVLKEQQELVDPDLIVLQYPIYWYSVPPILKQWFDDVLTHGFAFGKDGNKLKGKRLLISITTGGKEESYGPEGHNLFDVEDMLIPIKQLANHVGMHFLKPICSFDMEYIPGVQNDLNSVQAKAKLHSKRLRGAVEDIKSAKLIL